MGLPGRLSLVAAVLAVVLLACVALHVRRAQARAAEPVAMDLHGLAALALPAAFQSRGLDGADRSLSIDEQLARHDERHPLVFRHTRDPHNDWGGHARDPELLNVVLLPPAARADADAALRRYSIERYFSPVAGETVPLDSPRWTAGRAGDGGRYRWRLLAMDDAFGTDHAPRWAVTMLDAERGVRLDYFVWRKRTTSEQAIAFLRATLDGLRIQPALAAFHTQAGTPEQRLDRLRDARIAAVYAALAPLGVAAPAPGGTAFAPGVAAWTDDDHRALRVLRLLASVPLPGGATKADRDGQGRPRLPFVLTPGQYPGATRDGLPSLPLRLLYWNPSQQRWQLSGLQAPTMNEQHPLLPFEAAVVRRLEREPGARDAAHVLIAEHWFHPPVLDDARRVDALLAEADRWQRELQAGRIVGGDVRAPMLR